MHPYAEHTDGNWKSLSTVSNSSPETRYMSKRYQEQLLSLCESAFQEITPMKYVSYDRNLLTFAGRLLTFKYTHLLVVV